MAPTLLDTIGAQRHALLSPPQRRRAALVAALAPFPWGVDELTSLGLLRVDLDDSVELAWRLQAVERALVAGASERVARVLRYMHSARKDVNVGVLVIDPTAHPSIRVRVLTTEMHALVLVRADDDTLAHIEALTTQAIARSTLARAPVDRRSLVSAAHT